MKPNRPTRLLLPAVALVAAVTVAGCAKVASPGGGPEDRTLPRVAAIAPDSAAAGVRPDSISILFSKKMDRRSVRDWLFIAPPLAIREAVWKGERYDIALAERPDTATTYTLLLGSEVVDRRKNPLGPWATAFSTGGAIDDGVVDGSVHSGRLKSAGAYIYAWHWADSIGHAAGEMLPPLRIGQTEKDGQFRLDYLPRHVPLRICALYDAGKDRSFDAEDDIWACFDDPVTLDDTTRVLSNVEIYLVLDDEPGILKGTAIDSSCVGRGVSRLIALAREADSLAVLTGSASGDSAGGAALVGFEGTRAVPADSAALLLRMLEIDSLRVVARVDSARCAAPVVVQLFERDTLLVGEARGEGAFEFRDVSPGIYRVRAFRDADGDGVPQTGEPSGEYPVGIELLPGRTIEDLDFRLEQEL